MGCLRLLIFFIAIPVILDLVAPPATAQIDDGVCSFTADFCWRCSNIGTFNDGSIYQNTLNSLLSSFTSNSTSTNQSLNFGFHNSSIGQDPDKVNAIALCRGDVSLKDCHTCINDSSLVLSKSCSNQDEAILWAERCMVRYSNKLIFGVKEDEPIKYVPSLSDAIDVARFDTVLNLFLETLIEKAASGDSVTKFAVGHVTIQGKVKNQTIYGLLQCTPDLDKRSCRDCLEGAVSKIPECCGGKQGGRILKPSCNLRFEATMFFESSADSLVTLPSVTGKKRSVSKTFILIIIVGVIVIVLVIGLLIFFRVRKRWGRLKLDEKGNNSDDDISLVESLQYEFDIIRSATDDFSDANKLGQGGFGAVYKGRLPNGKYIAVKRLSKNSEQGDREFKTEVTLVAQLQHRNLVRLLGFCLKAGERILIYEYVPNTSLNHFIFDPVNHGHMEWETRYKIIAGIARGLLYLHEDSRLRIIHCDLKPSNILLDENMNPKIADFGMARLFLMDQTQGDTKTIVGTYGYMAPEYAIHGRFSVKTDVFSFGVLVLEILSGKRSSSFRSSENEEDLLSYAWRNWREDSVGNIMDPMLTRGLGIEMMRCIHIGLLCVQESVVSRPTMASVVSMLNSHSVTLSVPSRPAYYFHSNTAADGAAGSNESKNTLHISRNEDSDFTAPYPR